MNITSKVKVVSFLLCALTAPTLAAQEAEGMSGDWSFSGSVGQASFDSDSALQEGVDDSAWVLGVSGDYIQNNWVSSVGVDIVFYDDNQKFSQEVEGTGIINNGDRSTETSSASGGIIYVASGYQWLHGEEQNVALRLQGGFGLMTFSERSIGSCTNCYSEDIDIDGGLFIKASALRSGESVSVGGYIQQYVGDGINTVIGITIASSF